MKIENISKAETAIQDYKKFVSKLIEWKQAYKTALHRRDYEAADRWKEMIEMEEMAIRGVEKVIESL